MPKPLRADARRNRERILDVAEAVFDAKGTRASTEDVASGAGVGIGTVFRHFPTKTDLLKAIIGRGVERMAAQIQVLVDEGDPATAFFEFFTGMVAEASSKKTVVDLLGEAAEDLRADKPIGVWRSAIETLLAKAQDAGAVRADVQPPEVLALLLGTCQAAVSAGWDERLRDRTLAIVFDGLRARGPQP